VEHTTAAPGARESPRGDHRLDELLAALAREALLAEGELRWAQVALAAAAVEIRAGAPPS